MTPEEAEAAKLAILDKYARFSTNGRPKVCTPSRDEPTGHSAGKVIFQDREAAELAAAALVEIFGGEPQRVYECPRSRSGHAHLTRRQAWT